MSLVFPESVFRLQSNLSQVPCLAPKPNYHHCLPPIQLACFEKRICVRHPAFGTLRNYIENVVLYLLTSEEKSLQFITLDQKPAGTLALVISYFVYDAPRSSTSTSYTSATSLYCFLFTCSPQEPKLQVQQSLAISMNGDILAFQQYHTLTILLLEVDFLFNTSEFLVSPTNPSFTSLVYTSTACTTSVIFSYQDLLV